MKLLIAVPSKGRYKLITKRTLRYAADLGHDCKVFVEPGEYEHYAEVLDSTLLVSIGANDRGQGFAKVFIHDYAAAHGYDAVFKLDDDIELWSPGEGIQSNNRLNTASLLHDTLGKCIKKMQHPLVKAIGFPYKMQMFIQSNAVWKVHQTLRTAYVVKLDSMAAREDISTFEDFYTTLSIWVNGGTTLRYGRAGMHTGGGAYVGVTPGGMQCFDRKQLAEYELKVFKKLFPPLKINRCSHAWGYEPDLMDARKQLFGIVADSE